MSHFKVNKNSDLSTGNERRTAAVRAKEKGSKITSDKANNFHLEPLEQRVLFSADVGISPDPIDDNWDTHSVSPEKVADFSNIAAPEVPATEAVEVVFIDSEINGKDVIISDIQFQIEQGRPILLAILEPQADGITQITDTLTDPDLLIQPDSVNAIHIISHGNDNGIRLGDSWLSRDTVNNYRSELADWQPLLSDTADILIYGCDLAGSDDGRTLLADLASSTKADVAASANATGHYSLDADWSLEYAIGSIDVETVLSEDAQNQWEAELAAGLTAYDDSVPVALPDSAFTIGNPGAANNIAVTDNDVIDSGGTISLISAHNPVNGTLSTSGAWYQFTPTPGYIGDASFEYTVTDGSPEIQHHYSMDSNSSAAVTTKPTIQKSPQSGQVRTRQITRSYSVAAVPMATSLLMTFFHRETSRYLLSLKLMPLP